MQRKLSIPLALLFVLFLIMNTSVSRAAVVTIPTGSTNAYIQAAMTAATSPTEFVFEAGTYHAERLPLQNGDTVRGTLGGGGELETIFMGGRAITNWTRIGSTNIWKSTGTMPTINLLYEPTSVQQQGAVAAGVCSPDYPRCNYSPDIFIDTGSGAQWLKHVTPYSALNAAGEWYMEGADAYIYGDPTSDDTWVSYYSYLVSANLTDIVLEDFAYQMYRPKTEQAAIQADYGSLRWTVDNVDGSFNHASALTLRGSSTVKNSRFHHNGQYGAGAGGQFISPTSVVTAEDIYVYNNEIDNNNLAGHYIHWSAGGSKFTYTNRLWITNNYYHDNNGNGIWVDIDNRNTYIRYNQSDYNRRAGIFYETSWGPADISYNVVRYNGIGYFNDLIQGSQILVSGSQNVNVYDNLAVVCGGAHACLSRNPFSATGYGNGINVMNQAGSTGARRSSVSPFNEYLSINNEIDGNTIVFLSGVRGTGGVWADYNAAAVAVVSQNRYTNNTYYIPTSTDPELAIRFQFNDPALTTNNRRGGWSWWRQRGQDLEGTINFGVPSGYDDNTWPVGYVDGAGATHTPTGNPTATPTHTATATSAPTATLTLVPPTPTPNGATALPTNTPEGCYLGNELGTMEPCPVYDLLSPGFYNLPDSNLENWSDVTGGYGRGNGDFVYKLVSNLAGTYPVIGFSVIPDETQGVAFYFVGGGGTYNYQGLLVCGSVAYGAYRVNCETISDPNPGATTNTFGNRAYIDLDTLNLQGSAPVNITIWVNPAEDVDGATNEYIGVEGIFVIPNDASVDSAGFTIISATDNPISVTDSRIVKSSYAAFSDDANIAHQGGHYYYSSEPGAAFAFSFVGSGVTLYSARNTSLGPWTACLMGEGVSVCNTYSANGSAASNVPFIIQAPRWGSYIVEIFSPDTPGVTDYIGLEAIDVHD